MQSRRPTRENMREVLRGVRNYRDAAGRQLAKVFMRLPKAKLFPDYYEVVDRPSCLHMLQARVEKPDVLHPVFVTWRVPSKQQPRPGPC